MPRAHVLPCRCARLPPPPCHRRFHSPFLHSPSVTGLPRSPQAAGIKPPTTPPRGSRGDESGVPSSLRWSQGWRGQGAWTGL